MDFRCLTLLFLLLFSLVSAQKDQSVPAFLDPKKDTTAFINFGQETLDTILSYVIKNPKFIIDNNVSCKAKIVFRIEEDFAISTSRQLSEEIVELVVRNRVSKKHAEEIKKFYDNQARIIVSNLNGLFIPDKRNGEYYPTKFYINIDFTKYEKRKVANSEGSDTFDPAVLSEQTIAKNSKLIEKGVKMLKEKKYTLAFIYLRMAYFDNNDS